MKWRIFLLLTLAVGSARGQKDLRLYLEDLRGEGFRVLVNEYYQNEQPYQRLLLEGLAPGRHELIFLLDSHYLRRPLPELGPGLYHYVITENHRGQIQLRYRGALKSPPANSASLRLRKDKPWERAQSTLLALDQRPLRPLAPLSLPAPRQKTEKSTAAVEKTDSNLITTVLRDSSAILDSAMASAPSLVSPETPPRESPADPQTQMHFVQEDLHPEAADSSKLAASALVAKAVDRPAPEEPTSTAASKDTSDIPDEAITAPKALSEKAEEGTEEDESAWLARLAAQSYEYEKMQMARERLQSPLSPESCRAILKAFSYDQTRLLFLRQAISSGAFPYAEREQLLGAFEFEMSRQQVVNLENPLSP